MRHPVRVTFAVMVVGAAGLALWLLATSSSGPSTSRPPLPDAVAFVRAGPAVVMVGGETGMAADPHLVVLPLPGGEPRILARGGDIRPPSPSPNGRRVVFPWARVLGPGPPVPSLYTVRVDGSGPSRLTVCRPPRYMGDSDPSWSPDGTRIAFSAYPANASTPPEVYVVREDDTGLRRLTSCARPCRGAMRIRHVVRRDVDRRGARLWRAREPLSHEAGRHRYQAADEPRAGRPGGRGTGLVTRRRLAGLRAGQGFRRRSLRDAAGRDGAAPADVRSSVRLRAGVGAERRDDEPTYLAPSGPV